MTQQIDKILDVVNRLARDLKSDEYITNKRYYRSHMLGDRSRFMDYAPMPKTLNDTCSVEGCWRITAGQLDLCVAHMKEWSTRKADQMRKGDP